MLNKKVSDLMVKSENVETVYLDDCFHDAVAALNKNKWGAVFVLDKKNNEVKGIITDGDARRIFAKNQEPLAQLNSEPAEKFMNPNFSKALPDLRAIELMKTMNEKLFLTSPVIDSSNNLVGIIHIQHIVSALLKSL